jgi:uncharacterized protein YdhG (YjbR/CyaY superfamily)
VYYGDSIAPIPNWRYYFVSNRLRLQDRDMQYDVKTPAEYLKALAPDWRKDKLLEIRTLIKRHGPELKEGIKWGVLRFAHDKGGGFALNAQKNSVNFYVGTLKKVDPTGALLAGLDVGKGCVRFKKSTMVAETGISAFIKKAVTMLRNGEDCGC